MRDLNIDYEVKKCIELETENFGKRPVAENIIVCLYELGRVARNEIFAGGVLEQKDISIYAGEMCGELADVILQSLVMFYKLRGLSKTFKDMILHELIYVGIEKQQERMAEVKARTPEDKRGRKGTVL